MANIQNLDVYAYEDRTETLEARDSANDAADLTSKTVTWVVGRPPLFPSDGRAIFTKTGSVVSAPAGTFTVAIDAADTQYLDGDYEHMATTLDGSGLTAVVCRGRFRVRPVVS